MESGRILADVLLCAQTPNAKVKEWLKEPSCKYTEKTLLTWFRGFKDQLKAAVTNNCILQYQEMRLSQNWGDAGKEQVEHSFARCLLGLPEAHTISSRELESFYTLWALKLKDLGLSDLSQEACKARLNDFPMTIDGHTFYLFDLDELNAILRFFDDKWVLQGGYYGHYMELILGKGTYRMQGEYRITQIETELMRTPTTIAAMAAVIGNKEVFVRREALSLIVEHKWRVMGNPWYWADLSKIEHRISEGFKAQTLLSYHMTTPALFKKNESQFRAEMGETITYHELGHGIVQYYLLPINIATLGETTKYYGETIVTALLELLADIAPLYEDLHGPFYNMIKQSQKEPEKATRMAWMYASDTWFFDTEDTYMYIYSDLLACLYNGILTEKGDFNWTHLEALLRYPKNETDDSTPSLVVWALQKVTEILNHVEAKLKNFNYNGLSFQEFEFNCHAKGVEKYQHKKSISEYERIMGKWSEVNESIVKHHPELANDIRLFLETTKEETLKDMMRIVSSRECAPLGPKKARDGIQSELDMKINYKKSGIR